MKPPFPNPRFERKFVFETLSVPELQALIRRHPAGFREAYPPRIVNNIYLDSLGLTSYHDHINGSSKRSKTRVRWYGPPSARISKPLLEQKVKSGQISGKIVEQLPDLTLNGEGACGAIQQALTQTAAPDVLKLHVRQLVPSLFNRYERWYYVSADGRYRLTVDAGLQFGTPETQSACQRLPVTGQTVLLELKFLPDCAEGAERITNAFPFRLTRFSKYVFGIQRLQ
ncbi:MAG TPA: VTC domain-containing protein [Terriglobales bacterium]|nr:VTC domain-containing protein [Terriglobales bacterium]